MAKKPDKPIPSREYLLMLLDYDPSSGSFMWRPRPRVMFSSDRAYRSWNAKMGGRPALTGVSAAGYHYGAIWGRQYTAHRVAFKIMTGRDPVGVDHINGDPSDNRWVNLREADQSVNARNAAIPRHNTSGHIGVGWLGSRGKWIADIKLNGRMKRLGYFATKDAAIAARKAAEREFGFHPNHGRTANG